MITLAQFVDSYLTTRRALGFKLEREGRLLPDFVSFLDRAGHSEVTTEMALRWAMEPVGAAPAWHSVRLAMVRGFARWLVAFVPATEVPASDLLKPSRSRRAEPFPYTDADIAALMSAARALRSPLRAATYETLIGLLAVTGMRIVEVISLDRADIDWPDQVLTVRDSKFGKSRIAPTPMFWPDSRSYRPTWATSARKAPTGICAPPRNCSPYQPRNWKPSKAKADCDEPAGPHFGGVLHPTSG